jgi:hypothetical protein
MTLRTIASRRLPIARAIPPIAILHGVGSYWLVWSIAVGLLLTASLFVRLPVSALYLPAAALLGSAAAIAITLRSGGWLAVAGLAIVGLGYGYVLACPPGAAGIGTRACEAGPFISAHRAELAGALIGLPLALAIKGRDGRSIVLQAAALIAITSPALRVVFASVDQTTGSAGYERYLWTIRLEGAAALTAGALLGAMGRRSVFGLLFIGAALLLPWLGGTFRQWWEDMQFFQEHGIGLNLSALIQTEWQTFLPLIYFGLVLLGFAAARAGKILIAHRSHGVSH